ncbi:histidine kinase [Kribbella sp. NPDC051770]|uniref:sensor histidine kinase n=1 Tax=Kribbella sp. NPDC051770 TaxID=3155413 RepID=UPI003426132E
MANVLFRGSTYLRWVYLLLGAALVLAFILVDTALVSLVDSLGLPRVPTVIIDAILVVGPPVLLGVLPAVREVEGIAVESLLGVRFDERPLGPSRNWGQRRRTTLWFCLHLVTGGFIGILSTAVVGFGAVLLAAPFRSPGDHELAPGIDYHVAGRWTDLWMPLAALAGLVALMLLSALIGALLAYSAPRVLGPTPAERIELLERRTATLAERNRLARELHDSVGHALSLVTIQAAAARRVLATDPAFAETALAAMETSARAALADLDHVLGLLRDDRRSPTTPQATLADITRLVEATRAGGITVEIHSSGDLSTLPAAVSREAYRIIQEGLTNAIRHAGRPADEVEVSLSIALGPSGLLLELTNPVGQPRPQPADPTSAQPGAPGTRLAPGTPVTAGTSPTPGTPSTPLAPGASPTPGASLAPGTFSPPEPTLGGGRGLAGIRERVAVLRGTVEAGLLGDHWRLAVTLPVAVTTKGRA